MHELLYAAAPMAAGAWAGTKAWARRRALARHPGDPAPAFDLEGTDGRRHRLDSIAEPIVVLVFMSNRCPGVKAYDARLRRLVEEHRGKAAFVGINPMDEGLYPRERLPDMRRALEDRRLAIRYLKDPDGAVAEAYGAVCTPEVVVLDAERRIAYRGRIDDSMTEGGVRWNYLADALRALERGRRPRLRETAPLGCAIHATAASPIVQAARRRPIKA